MAVMHHVENTNCNLKRNSSQGRLRLDTSHQREPVVDGLCLECPNSGFLTARKITRYSEPFKSRLGKKIKNLRLHSLTVGKPSADFLRPIFFLSFFLFMYISLKCFAWKCYCIFWEVLLSLCIFFQCNYKFLSKYALKMIAVRTWNQLVDKDT